MQQLPKYLKTCLLLVFIALVGLPNAANAEQINKSVKDCFDQPDACEEPISNQQKDKKSETKVENKQIGVTAFDFIKMIFAMLFVIALLYFILKFINKKSRTFKHSQIIDHLGGTSLGANRSVQIIKVGERVLIVGVGDSIQLLKEIEDPNECRNIIEEYNNKMEQLVQPSDIVTKLIERTKQKKTEQISPFKSLLKDQLQDMVKERKDMFEKMEQKGSRKNE